MRIKAELLILLNFILRKLKNITSKSVLVTSIILVLFSVVLSGKLIFIAKQNQKYRIDLAEINSIQYGLLNADEWKIALTDIITKKVEEFELTPENQEQLKQQIEVLLYRLLDEVKEIFKNDMGRIKQILANAFVDFDKLYEEVPELSEALLEELAKPENKENMREYLLGKLDTFAAETFNTNEQLKLKQLLAEYQFSDRNIATVELEQLCNKSSNELKISALVLIVFLSAVFFLNVVYGTKSNHMGLFFLLIVALIFLINGISIPMIDIEAKISQLSFTLMGENIIFKNQVLFFQSKSILDVFWILVSTKKIDMILVGFLILTFSVIFPLIKLFCSFLTIRFPRKFEHVKWIQFFTYKSGKWSMADVFVVALFMSFIGFNGIISNQLSYLSSTNEYVKILTTNGTNLQVGFYLFLMFCLAGLFLSEAIQKRTLIQN